MTAIIGVLHENDASSHVLNIEDLDSVVIPHQQEWESLCMVSRHLINLEVKGVGAALGNSPCNFGTHLLLGTVDHVKLLVVLDTHYKLVWLVLDTSRYITLGEVRLCQRHHKFKCSFCRIALQLAKEHAVITAKADFTFSCRHNDVKDSIDFERLRLQHFAHIVYLDNVNVAKMLSKDEELFLDAIVLVLEQLDIIDTLLQFFVIFLFKSINVEDEKMTVVTSDPS